MRKKNALLVASLLAMAFAAVTAACSGKKATGGVAATIHVVRGASSGSAFAFAPHFAGGDGLYFLSPDQAKLTITSIDFKDASGGSNLVALTGCTPTYLRNAPGLTPLLDCPFVAPIGSWIGVTMNISPITEILVNDSANGLYTSASGLSTTPPATVGFTPLTVPNGSNGDFPGQIYFPTPLVISSTNAELSILVDMNHTVFADVAGGTATFNTSLPISPATVIASANGGGKATFYSATGTANNYNAGTVTGDDYGSVRLYYPEAGGQPGFMFFVTPGPGDAYPLDAATSAVGGYLGRDASGTICWANAAQDASWSHYKQFCAMQEATNLGATTTLSCKNADPAPTPVSGGTYASGCPAIGTPDFTETLTLVAQ